jgi:hypothetical protein
MNCKAEKFMIQGIYNEISDIGQTMMDYRSVVMDVEDVMDEQKVSEEEAIELVKGDVLVQLAETILRLTKLSGELE